MRLYKVKFHNEETIAEYKSVERDVVEHIDAVEKNGYVMDYTNDVMIINLDAKSTNKPLMKLIHNVKIREYIDKL